LFQIGSVLKGPEKRLEQRLIEQSFDQGRFIEQHDEFRNISELPQRFHIISVLRGTTASRNCSRATRGLSHGHVGVEATPSPPPDQVQVPFFCSGLLTSASSKHAANCLSNNASSASNVAA
jgi:hypothetical protein